MTYLPTAKAPWLALSRGDLLVEEPDGQEHAGMAGAVETAIRESLAPGTRLPTPTGRATFVVAEFRADALILLLGHKRARTPLTWQCLEGLPDFLRSTDWVRVGANRELTVDPTTLDGYLKGCLKRQTADYVAVLLERAGIVDLRRARPAHVRLRSVS